MSYLRFNHLFIVLMLVSAALAFVVPARYARRVQPQIQSVFAPISRPVAVIAGWVSNRVAPPAVNDSRAAADIRQENEQLRAEVAMLRVQVKELAQRDLELSKLGELKDLCRLAKVVGFDAGSRDSISIAGSTLMGLKDEEYVLYPGGLVGQVQRAGVGGAQVRLITDLSSRVRVHFARFAQSKSGTRYDRLGIPVVLAEGAGNGTMVVRALSLAEIGYSTDLRPLGRANGGSLQEGDYALLDDGDCPTVLHGQVIGRVTHIARRPDARLFAEIRIQPTATLKRLSEVMVMVTD